MIQPAYADCLRRLADCSYNTCFREYTFNAGELRLTRSLVASAKKAV